MSLIRQLVIRIHFSPLELAGILLGLDGTTRPNSGIVKEHEYSTHLARSGQRHKSRGHIDQVVMVEERRRKKIQQSKKTNVTTANQNGNQFRAERSAASQEHMVIEPAPQTD